jgi:hypothetical protein
VYWTSWLPSGSLQLEGRLAVDMTQLFSLRENAIAKEPGSS